MCHTMLVTQHQDFLLAALSVRDFSSLDWYWKNATVFKQYYAVLWVLFNIIEDYPPLESGLSKYYLACVHFSVGSGGFYTG